MECDFVGFDHIDPAYPASLHAHSLEEQNHQWVDTLTPELEISSWAKFSVQIITGRRAVALPIFDRSTPLERRWLDKLLAVRWDMRACGGILVLSDRSGKQGMWVGQVRRKFKNEKVVGVYAMSLAWIKAEIKKIKRRKKVEESKEIRNMIGAGI